MNKIMGVLDSYLYRTLVWEIFAERWRAPSHRRSPDERKILDALPKAETCLQALTDISAGGPWLAGEMFSLADLHAAPMVAYLVKAPEGAALLARHPGLERWWRQLARRPSVSEICT